MSFIAKRLVAFAGATVADPFNPADPQLLLVQGRVGVSIEPSAVQSGPYPLAQIPDFWDVLTYEAFDKSPYVILYEAEMYDTGIVVKRDLFGPGDYPVTWAGWEIPGDPELAPREAPVPPTLVLTPAQEKVLAYIGKKQRKGG